jgi:hypothetical protein
MPRPLKKQNEQTASEAALDNIQSPAQISCQGGLDKLVAQVNGIALGFRNHLYCKASRSPDMDRTMQNVSKQTPNAERLTKHRRRRNQVEAYRGCSQGLA